MKHLGFASIAALKQYLRYAAARHIDTRVLQDSLGLTKNIEQSDEGRITGNQFQAFLAGLVAKAQDPALGLSSAFYVQTHSYSLLGTISERSKTLGEAIERIPLFERIVGDMGITEIERSDTSLSLIWHCNYDDPTVVPHMVDNVLASWTLYARWLMQNNTPAKRVLLTKPQPDREIVERYQAVFQCPVLFSQRQDSIEIDRKHLSLTLQPSNKSGPSHVPDAALEGKARTQLAQLQLVDERFDEQVLRSIRAHLQLGIVRKEWIAQEFNMSERNLQRHLAEGGSSYRKLLDYARKERACAFLKRTELTTTEIAHNLGYQDERCFFRSFKRWTEQTPLQYRIGDR